MAADISNASARFAAWIKLTHPELFDALAKAAEQHVKTAPIKAALKPKGLGGFLDMLDTIASDVTSGIGNVVQNVGSFLESPDGMKSLTGLASSYLQNQAQQAVLQTQTLRARAGQSPAPIAYTTAQAVSTYGQAVTTQVPILQGAGGQFSYMSPAQLKTLTPGGFLAQYGVWLAIGGAALLLVMVLTRR